MWFHASIGAVAPVLGDWFLPNELNVTGSFGMFLDDWGISKERGKMIAPLSLTGLVKILLGSQMYGRNIKKTSIILQLNHNSQGLSTGFCTGPFGIIGICQDNLNNIHRGK